MNATVRALGLCRRIAHAIAGPCRAPRLRGCVLVFLAAAGLSAQAREYTVALNHAPPYRIVQEAGGSKDYSGIYIDVIREAAARAGIDLRFKVVPFQRALVLMENGGADIMLGPNRTPERELFLDYLEVEVSRERKVFYLGRGTPDIATYQDLGERRIGVLRGATYFDRFDADVALQKFEVSDYETGLRILERGRIDTLIMPELQGDYLLKKRALSLAKSSLGIEGRPSYIAVSRKSSLGRDRGRLVQALTEMKTEGDMEQIFARYR